MPADGFIQVPPDSAGKKVDTLEMMRPDASLVERDRVAIDDGAITLRAVRDELHELRTAIEDFKWALLKALR